MIHFLRHRKLDVLKGIQYETHSLRQMQKLTGVKSKQMASTTEKRIKILSDDEISEIYSRPQFTDEEQKRYFDLSSAEQELLSFLRSVRSKISFILQLGYFKAKHLFFTFDFHEVKRDVEYITTRYFPDASIDKRSTVDKRTRQRQRGVIEHLQNYQSCDKQQREKLVQKARKAVSVFCKPVYVFRELIHYLSAQRIVAPGYSFMQDTIGQALSFEHNRLITIVSEKITPCEIEALKHLLSDSPRLYEITHIKRDPKDFSLKEMRQEISRGQQIHHLYGLAQRLMPSLKISAESIK